MVCRVISKINWFICNPKFIMRLHMHRALGFWIHIIKWSFIFSNVISVISNDLHLVSKSTGSIKWCVLALWSNACHLLSSIPLCHFFDVNVLVFEIYTKNKSFLDQIFLLFSNGFGSVLFTIVLKRNIIQVSFHCIPDITIILLTLIIKVVHS